ncbi:SRPBCC family protein [Roseibium sp. CAU 1637]|uniref:SRPBCC family protein n=1 Tax=Roseibium limicola TaxID=2816037 RepID=A0A939JAU9_9HYPH|nr:SRPBCC family protein [Roseibium limicola]MBO0347319.1 SRPBCC family protein [Roseibium limicola]
MPSFSQTQTVNHSAADMFNLVADVEQYPVFVPLCQSLSVRGRKSLDDGREVLVADMTVAYKIVRETFTSRVELRPDENVILVEYLDGPFKQLENKWTFTDRPDGKSDIGFFISYEFKSRALGSLMGAMFDRAFRKFSSAFESRADEVYGV